MDQTEIDRRNKPIRDGEKYCAPFCGGGCTWTQYQHALKIAQVLCNRMGSDKWKPEVWENLGWHAKIVRPGCEIYIHTNKQRPTSYWINLKISGLGQITLTTSDPVNGFNEVLCDAANRILSAQTDMVDLRA